jgi:hypothetical protein
MDLDRLTFATNPRHDPEDFAHFYHSATSLMSETRQIIARNVCKVAQVMLA